MLKVSLVLCLPRVLNCTGCAAVPPELLTEGSLSRAADVYAFGVMIWEMATSSRAWAGMSHTQAGHHPAPVTLAPLVALQALEHSDARHSRDLVWRQQVLTAVGYNHKRLLFPDFIDKDVVVRW
jgi:serine/threonine protein kinase